MATPYPAGLDANGLIAAGYDTTSASQAWAAHWLMSASDVWQRVSEELDATLSGRELELADLPKLRYLGGIMHRRCG